MRHRVLCASISTLAVLSPHAVAASRHVRPAARQQASSEANPSPDQVAWRGRLSANQALEIKGVNGSVQALASTGLEAEVWVAKRARRSNLDSVRIDVVSHAGGVTVCAVYPDADDHEPNVCAPGSAGHMKVNNNDVRVDFTVYVPAAVAFIGRTVNGDVSGDSLKGNSEGYTVNGSVSLSTTGYAQAETVNRSINASVGKGTWTDTCEFRTVNGGITLDLPADLKTLVRAETVNGQISSDFPMTITGRFSPRRLRATIGEGDMPRRELALATVNGNIQIRRTR